MARRGALVLASAACVLLASSSLVASYSEVRSLPTPDYTTGSPGRAGTGQVRSPTRSESGHAPRQQGAQAPEISELQPAA